MHPPTAIFNDENACFDYLEKSSVFYKELQCPKCQTPMCRNIGRGSFRCPRHPCRAEINLRVGTFFFKSRLTLCKIMSMGWQWLNGTPISSFPRMFRCSKTTANEYKRNFQKLAECSLEEKDTVIGGPGTIVELDECKFGRRKYNRGHRVDGTWVLGGVERANTAKAFFVSVPDRSTATLLPIIKAHVHEGSTVLTDMWKAYDCLQFHGFVHQSVNHSKYFKDPHTGTHTNTIEGMWNGLKIQIKPRSRTSEKIDFCLWEAVWRRQHRADLWGGFISALRDVHFEIE